MSFCASGVESTPSVANRVTIGSSQERRLIEMPPRKLTEQDIFLSQRKPREPLMAPTVVLIRKQMLYWQAYSLVEYDQHLKAHNYVHGNIWPGSVSGWQESKLWYCNFEAWQRWPDMDLLLIQIQPTNPNLSVEKLATTVDIDPVEDRIESIKIATLNFFLDILGILRQSEKRRQGQLPF